MRRVIGRVATAASTVLGLDKIAERRAAERTRNLDLIRAVQSKTPGSLPGAMVSLLALRSASLGEDGTAAGLRERDANDIERLPDGALFLRSRVTIARHDSGQSYPPGTLFLGDLGPSITPLPDGVVTALEFDRGTQCNPATGGAVDSFIIHCTSRSPGGAWLKHTVINAWEQSSAVPSGMQSTLSAHSEYKATEDSPVVCADDTLTGMQMEAVFDKVLTAAYELSAEQPSLDRG